jgi:hypothetical protein
VLAAGFVGSLCAGVSTADARQDGSDTASTLMALAVHQADGRTTYRPLRATIGSGWTPLFPRVEGADTDRDGLPLSAMDITHQLSGDQAVVRVALIYGRPHQRRIDVETVTVAPGAPVPINGLAAYGVEPIGVSITEVPATLAAIPLVSTPSLGLDATVELAPGDGTELQVVIVNRTARAVRGFRIQGTRTGRPGITAYRRGSRHTFVIPAGGGLIVPLPTTIRRRDGVAGIATLDRVQVTSVTWSDGTVDGDRAPAVLDQIVAAGTAHQLAHVLAAVREAGDAVRPQSRFELRGRIDALTIDVSLEDAAAFRTALPHGDLHSVKTVQSMLRAGMQQAKDLVLADLEAFVTRPSAETATFAQWLATHTMEYEDWVARIRHLLPNAGTAGQK